MAEQNEITLVSPVNFAIDDILEMNPYTFVMYPKFDEVIIELESVVREKNIQNLSVIRFESGFSKSSNEGIFPKKPHEAKRNKNIIPKKPYIKSCQNLLL